MGRPLVTMSSQLHLFPAKRFLCGDHSQVFHSQVQFLRAAGALISHLHTQSFISQ